MNIGFQIAATGLVLVIGAEIAARVRIASDPLRAFSMRVTTGDVVVGLTYIVGCAACFLGFIYGVWTS